MELLLGLKALSDGTRLKIVRLLLQHDFCVGALAKQLNVSEPAISQHLQVLRKANLVTGEKRGYFTHYYVRRQELAAIAHELIALTNQPARSTENVCCRKEVTRDE